MEAMNLPGPHSATRIHLTTEQKAKLAKLEELRLREYLTRAESADYIRCSERQLDYLTKEGIIPRIKLNTGKQGKVLYRRADLDTYLEHHLEQRRAQ